MKMSPLTKSLSIHLLTIRLSIFLLLHVNAHALDTSSSLGLIHTVNVAASNETDFHALLAFKSNILKDYQLALSTWNDSRHFCHWQGVQCGRRHERVTAIALWSSGLSGSLSPYVGNLSFLRELDLGENAFTGVIPSELGNLFRLQKLILHNNSFEGKIPPSLSQCSNLEYLFVGYNKLIGELPKELASSMPRLKVLSVHMNNLSGGIPQWIGNLTSLVNFSAASNPFGGRLPKALGQLRNLRVLGLGGTQISGTIPHSLYNMSSLAILDVSDNRLQGNLPPTFGSMFPQLEIIQIHHNQLHGPIPLSISNLSKLERLEIGVNNFTGKIRSDFGNLQNLKRITLGDNNFDAKGLDGLAFLGSLTNCSNLEKVMLGNGPFGGVLPDFVGNLSTSVFILALEENQLYGSIPSTIGNLINLEVLALGGNRFTGQIFDSIGYLRQLKVLDFSYNSITGKIPNAIGNLSLLIDLRLGINRLEGAIPLTLGNCRNLLLLTLSENNLTGCIPRQLFTISSLSIGLYLGGNRLSGSLPPEVGNLKNLALIDISENSLSGVIPWTLGSCSSLENLYLYQNFFQGSIPSSMGSLRAIQNLDLSNNNLSGQIPRFLGILALKYLNLSSNNLEGELPVNGVFTNASAIFVAGNYRLCGGIFELQLPRCPTKKSRRRIFLFRTLGITIASIFVGVALVLLFIISSSKKKRETKCTVLLLKDPLLKISYGELLKATEGFSSTKLVGFGRFGRVYKGVIEQDGELSIAVKVLDLQTRGATKSFMAECEALRNIRHRNLVSIITSCSSVDFQGNEFKALVYEFMANGNLDNWLHPIPEANNSEREFMGLDLLQRVDIAIDVATALDYLHHHCQSPIIHCDLKPSNILLDGDMVAHVGDFGLARFCSELAIPSTSSSTAIKGTIGYAAPEYGLGSEMSTSGDIYSYGILLLEMITSKRPTDKMFEADHNLHNFARIALPQHVMEIVDPMLLIEDTYGNKMMESLISLIKIGLACSIESPKDRMNINTALHELHVVKKNLLKGNMDR